MFLVCYIFDRVFFLIIKITYRKFALETLLSLFWYLVEVKCREFGVYQLKNIFFSSRMHSCVCLEDQKLLKRGKPSCLHSLWSSSWDFVCNCFLVKRQESVTVNLCSHHLQKQFHTHHGSVSNSPC